MNDEIDDIEDDDNDENIVKEMRRFNLRTGEWEETNHFQINKKYFVKRKGKIRECLLIKFFTKEKHEKAKIIYCDTIKWGEAFLDELHESPENIEIRKRIT